MASRAVRDVSCLSCPSEPNPRRSAPDAGAPMDLGVMRRCATLLRSKARACDRLKEHLRKAPASVRSRFEIERSHATRAAHGGAAPKTINCRSGARLNHAAAGQPRQPGGRMRGWSCAAYAAPGRHQRTCSRCFVAPLGAAVLPAAALEGARSWHVAAMNRYSTVRLGWRAGRPDKAALSGHACRTRLRCASQPLPRATRRMNRHATSP